MTSTVLPPTSFLDDTTAGEVMTQHVVIVRPEMSLADAAAVLLEHQLSGAPVVNQQGVCVGVLTAADFVKSEQHRREDHEEVEVRRSNLLLPDDFYAGRLAEIRERFASSTDRQVSQVMTRDLMTVSQRTALRHVIDCMVTAHVHRVFVLDSDDRLAGVITTMDILAALLGQVPSQGAAAPVASHRAR
jgi:predicted transcriptional regulator